MLFESVHDAKLWDSSGDQSHSFHWGQPVMNKLVLAVLSDIHFSKSPTHPIAAREEMIASAIASAEVQPSAIVLLFSGDIADKGTTDDYAVAQEFVIGMRNRLTQRFPGVAIHILCVPGNHDLEHPEGSEEYRKGLIEGSGPTMRDPAANSFYLKRLLEPQLNYWEFARLQSVCSGSDHSPICSFYTVKLGPNEVRFNLLNTAILSQMKESQGSLVLPVPFLQELFTVNSVPHLTITVMHHPTYWIEDQTLTELRDLLGLHCEYVISGHEHFSSGYEIKPDLGQSIRYYESPALFDPKRPLKSAFRVLVLDMDASRERHFLFEWSTPTYKSKASLETSFEWREIESSRIASKSLRMNPAALAALNDPGVASPRRGEREAKLTDLFEYPDLQVRKDLKQKQAKLIKSSQVLAFLTDGGIKELHGAPLSGKTALSKALTLDIRAHGIAIPLWLDGKGVICSSIDEFEKLVRTAVRNQYSREQMDAYWQLPPERRCIIIDNWHLAAIRSDRRPEIYGWLTKFSSSAILLVDQTYQIRELVSVTKLTSAISDQVLQGITHLEIGNLSHVSRARLIHKFLRLRHTSESDTPEESTEAKKIETILSQLLGKDRLPAFAFFILCILQALTSNKTDAISGGSLGPLYELLILEALARERPDDRELPKKIVFLQEIAFYMWSQRTLSATTSEIRSLTERYTASSYVTLPTDRFLDELTAAKILEDMGGNYGFSYEQYLHYFVAHYFRDHIDEKDGDELRRAVDKMIDEISSPENSTIVMFLIYFEKEKERIIDRLVDNASRIYSAMSPARLESDGEEFSRFNAAPPEIHVDETPDVAGNREALRASKDVRDEKRMLAPNRELELAALRAYPYSENLPEHCKLHMASQSIYALGQVIRNFSANLSGEKKVEVLKQTYLLALRALARVMDICKSVIVGLQSLKTSESPDASILKLRRMGEELFVLIAQIYASHMCNAVSDSVGVADMDRAYIETVQELGSSVAVRMIDLTVQMNHFLGFPERQIRDLYQEVKSNAFSATTLQLLVVGYIMHHKLDEGMRNRTIMSIGLKPKALSALKA
jgi:hypothetical protein